ncbi:ABC transporter permease [Actinomyces wuliandei]|uniref:ABC transporter permease n=1 Tax=Actinomyces wuliandei TaxID=2057743 RepID=UPI00214C6A64|nr:ABC transporter permease [Actinomyces wuliandei]
MSSTVPRPQGRSRTMTNRRMFVTMLAGAVFRRRSRVLSALLSSAVGAVTLFSLAAVCLAVPAQMSAQMRQFGANFIVVPLSVGAESSRITLADKQEVAQTVAAATGRQAEELPLAAYRYETVRINRSPYLLAGVDVEAVRGLNGHWSLEGAWPGEGEVLVGKDVAEAVDLGIGSTVTLEYLSSDNLERDGSHQHTQEATDPATDLAAQSEHDGHSHGSGQQPGDQAPTGAVATSSASGSQDEGSDHSGHSGHSGDGAGSEVTKADEAAAGQASWRVSGLVDTGGEEDDIVYAPTAQVEGLTGTRDVGYDIIEVSVDVSSTSMDAVVEAVDGVSQGVRGEPVSKITSGDTRIVTMLNTLFWVVSVVVLGLTLVGVSTTMTMVVSQRRKEIGLRKALGASGRSIAAEFYSEVALLGALGGVVGAGLGYALAVAVCLAVFDTAIAFSWPLALACVLLSALVAVVASCSPVRRASRIDPALVLREE